MSEFNHELGSSWTVGHEVARLSVDGDATAPAFAVSTRHAPMTAADADKMVLILMFFLSHIRSLAMRARCGHRRLVALRLIAGKYVRSPWPVRENPGVAKASRPEFERSPV
jgi:hypothetical protein